MTFDANSMDALNLLLQFDSATLERGIKVHSSARPEVVDACRRLFERGLISLPDGGYLTDAGVEARNHALMLAGLVSAQAG